MIPLYDAHNHLHDDRLAPNLLEILDGLPRVGLKRCVVNGTCEKDWPHVQALAKRFDWIIPAFGLHPWFASERSAAWFDDLQKFLDTNPRATVGEIGLDRWMKNPDIVDQERVFVQQLELAAHRNVAASIHCLKAWGHLQNVLENHRRPARGILIHSYGGSAEMIPIFAKLSSYFSISGYFAHERKAAQREAFKKVPIERLLVETDAPDMAPPSEDKLQVNDPRNLPAIYDFASKLFEISPPEFARQMQANFQRLFS